MLAILCHRSSGGGFLTQSRCALHAIPSWMLTAFRDLDAKLRHMFLLHINGLKWCSDSAPCSPDLCPWRTPPLPSPFPEFSHMSTEQCPFLSSQYPMVHSETPLMMTTTKARTARKMHCLLVVLSWLRVCTSHRILLSEGCAVSSIIFEHL